VDANDVPLLPYFPYAALPHNPFSHEHHIEQKSPSTTKQVSMAPMGGGALSLAGAQPAKTSTLAYTMAAAGHVSLKIYNAAGRELRTLVDQDAAPGTFHALWDGRDDTGSLVGRGVYFARFVATGAPSETRKIVLE
jgi:flagellar hook assembly protein FlgD